MTIEKCIKQLESLRAHCDAMDDGKLDSTDCWDKDVQALDMAIEAMAEAAAALKRANAKLGFVCVQGSPDVDPAPEVEWLQEQLAKVTAERDALAANSRPAAYGEWEEIRDPYGKIEGWICKCGSESRIKSDFCPYCGADMRGKKEENQC